ncbi:FimB/Mfa2 family fimbrial subunit [Mucilaginibacter sp. HD30]
MKNLFCLGLLVLFFASCQKISIKTVTPKDTAVKKYPISFSTSGFSSSISDLQSSSIKTLATSAPLMSYPLSLLTYTAYDSQGNVVSRLQQYAQNPTAVTRLKERQNSIPLAKSTLGTFVDTLAAGTYTCIVTAGQEESNWDVPATLAMQNLSIGHPNIFSSLSQGKFYPSLTASMIYDGFVYKGQMTVGPNNTSQSLKLNRIVGKLKIVIEDALALNVDGVLFEFEAVGFYYDLNKMVWDGTTKETYNGNINVGSYAGKAGYSKEIILSPGTHRFTMKFLDANQKVIVSKQLSVPVVANQVTTLIGKAFTTQNTTGFTTSIDQNWETGSSVKF